MLSLRGSNLPVGVTAYRVCPPDYVWVAHRNRLCCAVSVKTPGIPARRSRHP